MYFNLDFFVNILLFLIIYVEIHHLNLSLAISSIECLCNIRFLDVPIFFDQKRPSPKCLAM